MKSIVQCVRKSFKMISKIEGLIFQFKFTTPGKLQQNGKVERSFATLYGRVRIMLNEPKIHTSMRQTANTATHLESFMINKEGGSSPHSLFYDKQASNYLQDLRIFGKWNCQSKLQQSHRQNCRIEECQIYFLATQIKLKSLHIYEFEMYHG